MTRAVARTYATVGLGLAIAGGLGGLIVRVLRPASILPTAFGVGPSNLVAIAVLNPASLGLWVREAQP